MGGGISCPSAMMYHFLRRAAACSSVMDRIWAGGLQPVVILVEYFVPAATSATDIRALVCTRSASVTLMVCVLRITNNIYVRTKPFEMVDSNDFKWDTFSHSLLFCSCSFCPNIFDVHFGLCCSNGVGLIQKGFLLLL
jgi:hypothetical protein